MGAAIAAWWAIAVAAGPDYDAFSEKDGYIATEAQERAAWAMLHDPEQVEAVYADAAKGSSRAAHVIEQLEATLAATGRKLADRASEPDCLVPAANELRLKCRPIWVFIDFLSQDRPGGIRLRSAILRAFAVRAHERGLENQLVLSLVNGLLSAALVGAVLGVASLPRPLVLDQRLNRLVYDLYKGETAKERIGTGSTADAIRYEAKTGKPVGRKFHTTKGQEYIRALENWLADNPGASPQDRAAAQAMMDDLRRALAGH